MRSSGRRVVTRRVTRTWSLVTEGEAAVQALAVVHEVLIGHGAQRCTHGGTSGPGEQGSQRGPSHPSCHGARWTEGDRPHDHARLCTAQDADGPNGGSREKADTRG